MKTKFDKVSNFLTPNLTPEKNKREMYMQKT